MGIEFDATPGTADDGFALPPHAGAGADLDNDSNEFLLPAGFDGLASSPAASPPLPGLGGAGASSAAQGRSATEGNRIHMPVPMAASAAVAFLNGELSPFGSPLASPSASPPPSLSATAAAFQPVRVCVCVASPFFLFLFLFRCLDCCFTLVSCSRIRCVFLFVVVF